MEEGKRFCKMMVQTKEGKAPGVPDIMAGNVLCVWQDC